MNPTTKQYSSLDQAYQHLNTSLFDGKLPSCLITMQRKSKTYGFFASKQFLNKTNHEEVIDEIALNPALFTDRTQEEILATLTHEMVHLWQHHNGTPSRNGYHNKQWAFRMNSIGLHPLGANGKETGQKVYHEIVDKGLFATHLTAFLSKNELYLYQDQIVDETTRKKKAESKTKYTCESCDLNAWAKPNVKLMCGECEEMMIQA